MSDEKPYHCGSCGADMSRADARGHTCGKTTLERLRDGEVTPMQVLEEIAKRQQLNVDRLLAEGVRLDLRNLPELLETAMVAPRIQAVKYTDGETGEDVAAVIKPDAEYIVIERAMAVELVLRACLLDQANARGQALTPEKCCDVEPVTSCPKCGAYA